MSEVADVFRGHGDAYCKKHGVPYHFYKVMHAIEDCRTSKLGGHVDECTKCSHINISYNSCRNRHCPKCQSSAREKWVEDRMKDLLPVGYFHVVLTIPQELNPLVLRNQKVMYDILFKAGSETLLELAKDMKHLGAEIGFTTILHTWGQNLMNHPHLHCIVPGGGLSFDGQRFIPTKKKDFFVHVNPISSLFRDKFIFYFKKANRKGEIKYYGAIKEFENESVFYEFTQSMYRKKWVVYCKPPFGGAEEVLEYIGRYSHRVAISNSRILKVGNGTVTFSWRDYKDGNKVKEMTVTAEEFIRRFLMHILPDGFVKIRHFGILSSKNKLTKLKKCKELLGNYESRGINKRKENDLLKELVEKTESECLCCGKGVMRTRRIIVPDRLSPPSKTHIA